MAEPRLLANDVAARRRNLFCRALIYGMPLLAAATTLSLFHVARSSPSFAIQSALGTAVFVNAFLALACAAGATIFLSGGQSLRLAGAFAYGAFGLLLYFILTITGLGWLQS